VTQAVWLIHGVVRADAPVPTEAPAHARIPCGDLAALASRVQVEDGAEAEVALALRHNAILLAHAALTDVAPVRLGAAAATPEAVSRAVAAEAERHRAALDRIAGAVEAGLRVVAPPARADDPADSPAAPPPSGALWLRQRAAARAAARGRAMSIADDARAVVATAAAQARATRVLRPGTPRMPRGRVLADLALLIPRAGFAAWAEAVAASAAAAGLAAEVSGRWPCYSFVAGDDAPMAAA
jgi:hypothetical protein